MSRDPRDSSRSGSNLRSSLPTIASVQKKIESIAEDVKNLRVEEQAAKERSYYEEKQNSFLKQQILRQSNLQKFEEELARLTDNNNSEEEKKKKNKYDCLKHLDDNEDERLSSLFKSKLQQLRTRDEFPSFQKFLKSYFQDTAELQRMVHSTKGKDLAEDQINSLKDKMDDRKDLLDNFKISLDIFNDIANSLAQVSRELKFNELVETLALELEIESDTAQFKEYIRSRAIRQNSEPRLPTVKLPRTIPKNDRPLTICVEAATCSDGHPATIFKFSRKGINIKAPHDIIRRSVENFNQLVSSIHNTFNQEPCTDSHKKLIQKLKSCFNGIHFAIFKHLLRESNVDCSELKDWDDIDRRGITDILAKLGISGYVQCSQGLLRQNPPFSEWEIRLFVLSRGSLLKDNDFDIDSDEPSESFLNTHPIGKYQLIMSRYKHICKFYSAEDIRKFADGMRKIMNNPSKEDQNESGEQRVDYTDEMLLAVINRANEIATGHRLRKVQFQALLDFLLDGNKFCQINTGEGKTTITSALAVFRVLKGEKVDIITSNPVLATDAIHERKLFYTLFGVSVTHNTPGPNDSYFEGLKPCYTHDVVYGTIGSFAFDHLHNHVEALGTKVLCVKNDIPVIRNYETVIIDESDNVILDNYALFTNQAKPIPGVDACKFIYFDIWMQLMALDKNKKDHEREELRVSEEKRGLLQQQIDKKQLEEKINKDDRIPQFVKDLLLKKLDGLLTNAIKSKYCLHVNEDYVICQKDGAEENILPLEKDIGVRLANFIWTDLHPFLQMKHNLFVNSCGSLTSVFIPNCAYIKQYRKIYGLTGTLGSEKEQTFIKDIFGVDCSIVPPFIENKRKLISKVKCIDEAEWLEKIRMEVDLFANHKERGVLLVCDTPLVVRQIEQYLRKYEFHDITIYENESEAHKVEDINSSGGIKSKHVIISTNIAGRGTDIKLSTQVLNNGGLHVITTYLPRNERTEKQAAGRAARSGNPGSYSIIFQLAEVRLLVPEGEDIETKTIDAIFELRDKKEQARLADAKAHLNAILEEYKLFQTFENHYYYCKSHRKVHYFILEDMKLQFGLYFENKLQTDWNSFFETIKRYVKTDCEDYRFVNVHYAVKYAQYLIRAGDFNIARKVLTYERLKDQGGLYGIIPIAGDGNCFFRAVADQLERNGIKNMSTNSYYSYNELRQKTLDYIKNESSEAFRSTLLNRLTLNDSLLRGDLPMSFSELNDYLEYHKQDGVWADSGMVEAVALCFKVTLILHVPSGLIYINNVSDGSIDEKHILNLKFSGNHYDSLLQILNNEISEFQPIPVDKYLFTLPAFYLTLFELELSRGFSMFFRLIQGVTSFDFLSWMFGDPQYDGAIFFLNEAQKVLQHQLKLLSTLIGSDDFKRICHSSDDQIYNKGENMMQKHLESEQVFIIITIQHIQTIVGYLNKNASKSITIKKSFTFTEVLENGLKVDIPVHEIFQPEIVHAEAVGLAIYYEVDSLVSLENNNPDVVQARQKILGGVSIISSAFIPGLSLISPVTGAVGGRMMRNGCMKLLSLIFNDPNLDVGGAESVGDYLLEMLTSWGGPVTLIPKLLCSILMEVGKSLMVNLLLKEFAPKVLDYTKQYIGKPIVGLLKVPFAKICKWRNQIYEYFKSTIIEPIRSFVQSMIKNATEYVKQYSSSALALSSPSSAADSPSTIWDQLQKAREIVVDIMMNITGLKNDLMNMWQTCVTEFKSAISFLNIIKTFKDLRKKSASALKDMFDIIKKFIKGDLLKSIHQTINNITNIISTIKTKLPEYIAKIKNMFTELCSIVKSFVDNPMLLVQWLLDSLPNILLNKALEKGFEFLSKLGEGIIGKVESFVQYIFANNPIDKWLHKCGIDLSNVNSTINRICSFAVEELVKSIKSMLFQPPKESTKGNDDAVKDGAEPSSASTAIIGGNRQCVPFALMNIFQLIEPDEFLKVIRGYFADAIKADQGLTKWQTKFILEDFGLKVMEVEATSGYSDTAMRYLQECNSIGGLSLLTRLECNHAYFLYKASSNSLCYIDTIQPDKSEIEKAVAHDVALNEVQSACFLIPINFSQAKRDEMTKRIRDNPNPNDSFSIKLWLFRILEYLFPGEKFGQESGVELSGFDCRSDKFDGLCLQSAGAATDCSACLLLNAFRKIHPNINIFNDKTNKHYPKTYIKISKKIYEKRQQHPGRMIEEIFDHNHVKKIVHLSEDSDPGSSFDPNSQKLYINLRMTNYTRLRNRQLNQQASRRLDQVIFHEFGHAYRHMKKLMVDLNVYVKVQVGDVVTNRYSFMRKEEAENVGIIPTIRVFQWQLLQPNDYESNNLFLYSENMYNEHQNYPIRADYNRKDNFAADSKFWREGQEEWHIDQSTGIKVRTRRD